ncbi:nucleotidyl transferase AbiEii/AbiGii toxin family protein [Mesorhizobium sp. AR07]|uniref:nucleotidyl transferase AbiEii/AbiGii toxin family protein n=1 Tax=Mesorhizobium sp. AR07 TaxID=2865838 RepID=UPI00215E2188|nr:nucleotidyl transferase AbiEii/AbiGii toxin family protein [Mesorhizobium sp. AR07]UVK44385.1 nucleotidyl transferase AbiEii/AbiGii toxin family protein [Mesorhizobium sp. AR07]
MRGTESEELKRGRALSRRTRDIAKSYGLDSRAALQRCVCEAVLWALQDVSAHDFVVKGGLLEDQRVRETDNADISYFVPRTVKEIQSDLSLAAEQLRNYGILWSLAELKILEMNGRVHGCRVPVRAALGDTRVATHVDISLGDLPVGAVRRLFGSIFKGPEFLAWAQPLEAQVADKFAIIVTNGVANTRLKDYRDLLLARWKGLDDTKIARALHRTIRERNADTGLLLGIPDGFGFEFADAKKAEWKAFTQDGGDFLDVVCQLRRWYAEISDRLYKLAAAGPLEPRSHVQAPGLEMPKCNVIELSAYRRMRA